MRQQEIAANGSSPAWRMDRFSGDERCSATSFARSAARSFGGSADRVNYDGASDGAIRWRGSAAIRPGAAAPSISRAEVGLRRRQLVGEADSEAGADRPHPPRGAGYAGTATGAGSPFVIALICSSIAKRSIRISVNAGFEATIGANISAR